MTKQDLAERAHHAGYAWAMLLGASRTNWHTNPIVSTLDLRDPLRAVHLHARLELAWQQGRLLHDFLFKSGGDLLSVTPFLAGTAITDWTKRADLTAEHLCPTVHKAVDRRGRANKKHFHFTEDRWKDPMSLEGYDVVRDELRRAFATCYGLMVGMQRDAFREGLDHEWSVSQDALKWP